MRCHYELLFYRYFNYTTCLNGTFFRTRIQMIDRWIYKFCGFLDNSIAFVETGVIKMVEWCWHSRVKLLNKRRKRK